MTVVPLVLLVALSVTTQVRSDVLVSGEVMRSVHTYARYTVFDDVRAEVQDGVVTLSGKVTLEAKKEDIGRRVAAVDGVRMVRNDISILPASSTDDELRHKVARAIYGNAAFWQYAAMANPPIHIIVERGSVTLTGVVRSDTDRALARSLATGHGETAVTCDLLVK